MFTAVYYVTDIFRTGLPTPLFEPLNPPLAQGNFLSRDQMIFYNFNTTNTRNI